MSSHTLRPKFGLCQECKQIKILAVDRTNMVNGQAVHTRLCWICMRKLVKQ